MVLNYPEAVFVPLQDTQALASTVPSALDTITRTALNVDGAIPIEGNLGDTFTNLDVMGFHDYGDDTNIDRTFQWIPEATGRISKFFINIATLCQVTVRTAEAVTFESVQITLSKVGGTETYFDQSFGTGFASQDATDEVRMFIVSQPVIGRGFPIRKGNPVNIRIRTITTGDTANITWEMGIPQLFPMTADSLTKFWTRSGILFYIERQVGVFK